MFFYRGNQVNINVKENFDRESGLGNDSLRTVYSMFKVRRAAIFNLPCASDCFKEPWDILTAATGANLLLYHWLPLWINHSQTSSLCSPLDVEVVVLILHSLPFPPALILIYSNICGRKQQFAVLIELLWERVSRVYRTTICQFLDTMLFKTIVLGY